MNEEPHPQCICSSGCPMQNILQSLSMGIIVFDISQKTITFSNQTADNMLSSIENKSYSTLAGLILGHIYNGLVDNLEEQSIINLDSRILGYTSYQSDQYVWTFLRDITEKVHLETIAESLESFNSIGYIFSAVRHELGNPINSVKSALSVIKQNFERFSKEDIHDYLIAIEKEMLRVEHLLASLKSFSMLEQPSCQQIKLSDFFKEFYSLAQPDAKNRGIKIILEDMENIPPMKADFRALYQIMINLLANAEDAVVMESSPIIRIYAIYKNNQTLIFMEDNGTGVNEKDLPHIFKPFYTTKSNGTGLGLVIVKKMMAKMNGTISIQNREPKGAQIILTFSQV